MVFHHNKVTWQKLMEKITITPMQCVEFECIWPEIYCYFQKEKDGDNLFICVTMYGTTYQTVIHINLSWLSASIGYCDPMETQYTEQILPSVYIFQRPLCHLR